MKNIGARLHAVEQLAHRCFAAAAAGAAAGTAYVAAAAIIDEVFAYVGGLEAGIGDAAALRLGPHDLTRLLSRRAPLVGSLEILAGFGVSATREDRRAALRLFKSRISDFRNGIAT